MCVKFHFFISDSSRDIKGSQILRWGVEFPLKLVPHFGVKVHALFGVDGGRSVIVGDGGDCQCEVSLRSYSPSNVELGLQNANFGGFGLIFLWARDLLTFGGALLNYIQTGWLFRYDVEDTHNEKLKKKPLSK